MSDDETATLTVGPRGAPEAKGAPVLIAVLRAEEPLAPSHRWSLADVDEVRIGRGKGPLSASREGSRLSVRVPDGWASTEHARLVRERDRTVLYDNGAKNGTFRQGVRVAREVLSDGDVIEIGHTFFVYRESQPPAPDGELSGSARTDLLLTMQPRLGELFTRLGHAASSPLPLLIIGETGTGKELVARSVHTRSGRSGKFVPVNCGAIPSGLVESELFGHRKGAFSSATEDRLGLVPASDHGTLFLDEIGELPASAQSTLLRALQEGEVRPVGATQVRQVDLRVVAATHRDLETMVLAGQFRADLLARLQGLTFRLPPLRERREDIGLIVSSLLARRAGDRRDVTLSHAMARDLFSRAWRRNVRELEFWLGGALALAPGPGPLEAPEGPSYDEEAPKPARPAAPPAAPAPPRELSEEERARRDLVAESLARHGGNVAAVARELGKGREQVYRWVERYGLDPEAYRPKQG
ncbi:MAG TPA: sigma 54-interacting transcriptional regulator [Polyangiaceae bacterium]|nr:sigma 54-interacting transcriptional regulator [Polyangiaceae bacterium]